MRRKRPNLANAGPLLAVVGVAVATFGTSDPGSRMAVPFLGVVGLLATELLLRLQRDRDTISFLRNLILLGIAARMLLFALIHQTVGPYVFAPDQWTYESQGMGLLNHWHGLGPLPSHVDETLQVGYPGINAVLFMAFGFAKSAPAVLNMFFSAWTAVPAYFLAMLVVRDNKGVARLAAGLTVFFPSLMLWSVLNIREAPTILTVVTALYFCVRLQHRPSFASLTGVVLGLSILTFFRQYMTLLVGSSVVAGILMGRSRSPVRAFVAGCILMVTLVYAAQSLGLATSLVREPSLNQLQSMRQGFLFQANSAYGATADVSTAGGALRFLPVGLTYFLLAPFPWDITSTLQAVTLPETVLWYTLLPMGLWGAWLGIRHDARMFTVPLASLVVVTFAYALVEGNVGTAYRHRAQVLPIIFVFCALGMRDIQALRQMRRQKGLERKQRAKSLTGGRVVAGGGGSPR